MSKARRLMVALVLPATILLGFAATAAAGGQSGKVDVCHFANHKYVEISERAASAFAARRRDAGRVRRLPLTDAWA
jgi:hypothetical protein